MFGQCLLLGTGIGGISTGVYATFTSNKYDTKDRKNEYVSIFSIILIVTTILLYIFHNSSQSLVSSMPSGSGGSVSLPTMNNYTKPPF